MGAAIVPAAIELVKLGKGAADKAAAKDEAERLRLTRPDYRISGEATNELNLAESELQQGLSARSERAYTTQMDKGLSNSLSAILMGGGNVNNIGALYGNADDGLARLTMIRENNRLSKIQSLVSAQRNMTEQQDKSFMYNDDQWWKNDAQANTLAKQNAENEFQSGINGLGSTATQAWQNAYEQKQMDKYLNPPQPPTPSTTNTTGYMPNTITSNSIRTQPNTTVQPPNFYQYTPQ